MANSDDRPALGSARPGASESARPDASFQQTLRNRISCTGVGLHSGVDVAMTLMPADPDTGIVFRRTDVDTSHLDRDIAEIPALWNHVSGTMLGTTLVNDHGTSVATVEHLMAALAGCGVDNAIVELNGGEVPIMDGSSAPFVFLIECAGIFEQNQVRRAIRVLKPVTVSDKGRTVTLRPAERFTLSVDIDFDSPVVAHQTCEFDEASMTFKDELCRARTFGFLHEVSALQDKGLARGGSLDNAVVVDGDRVMNEDGLRFADEFARHKALDAVGDLYLAGGRLLARYEGEKAGHEMNNRVLRALFADASAWEWCDDIQADVRAGVEASGQEEWVEERAVAMA
ncbi:MAG: UDP-3-O-acyl-N-acetylglucosamine deacetylase [Alphaproteobacteria bacterium]|nr:UDP-3-O-acyl-N-acetylglucosamine deacetylase [Alphaproteobacteria bacterium]MBT4018941.1 UDP-3-O-acyl-N-acetylglucosamine deacetylase [Alphaproteobacteria bacterium]MBT4966952.1 UDP-3-O-acyl-N-acetylglucosamine deacetylase [Alphaproteobacteria bacterium]MBT5160858.1 UDP-3-O-acyl-N-acetylglucosamine deacetylase [Alphaproteobacteria bacterium]MBT5919633.1 UDP-3-O-acyl-N-acetylglucosamine deacetylase [Alphaproteobacteria bacterium]